MVGVDCFGFRGFGGPKKWPGMVGGSQVPGEREDGRIGPDLQCSFLSSRQAARGEKGGSSSLGIDGSGQRAESKEQRAESREHGARKIGT